VNPASVVGDIIFMRSFLLSLAMSGCNEIITTFFRGFGRVGTWKTQ
jgi:hypothetical protein